MPPLDDALVFCHWRTKQQPPTHHNEHLNGENGALRCDGIAHCIQDQRPEEWRDEDTFVYSALAEVIYI